MNRTYFFRTFLLSILLFLTQVAFAEMINKMDYDYDKVSHTATLRLSLNIGGNVAIPSLVTDEDGITYRVIKIGDYAFANNPNVITITIPQSITLIGKGAFSNCI